MATRKQKRRREKELRHEYEVVYLDSEGNEVEPDEAETAREPKKAARNGAGRPRSQPKTARSGREPQPPSWQRSIRRGALFLPFILVFIYLTNRNNASPGGIAFVIVLFTVMVIPLGYYTDYLLWRSYQKRLASSSKKR